MTRLRVILCLSLVTVLAPQACQYRQGTGNISGRIVLGSIEDAKPHKGLSNVKIVLCHVDEGLPEGPVVSDTNKDNVQRIGVIRANPTTVSDADGRFMLREVPVGTYLVLFHLFPSELKSLSDSWDGVILTEACMDNTFQRILASGRRDFWEKGGLVSGKGSWDTRDGFRINEGIVGSESLGFLLMVRNQRPYPVVNVGRDSTVDVVLMTHIEPSRSK